MTDKLNTLEQQNMNLFLKVKELEQRNGLMVNYLRTIYATYNASNEVRDLVKKALKESSGG